MAAAAPSRWDRSCGGKQRRRSEETELKVRVPDQALRQQRAEPGPSPVRELTRKIPDNRVARGFRELGRQYLKRASESAFPQSGLQSERALERVHRSLLSTCVPGRRRRVSDGGDQGPLGIDFSQAEPTTRSRIAVLRTSSGKAGLGRRRFVAKEFGSGRSSGAGAVAVAPSAANIRHEKEKGGLAGAHLFCIDLYRPARVVYSVLPKRRCHHPRLAGRGGSLVTAETGSRCIWFSSCASNGSTSERLS